MRRSLMFSGASAQAVGRGGLAPHGVQLVALRSSAAGGVDVLAGSAHRQRLAVDRQHQRQGRVERPERLFNVQEQLLDGGRA